MQTDMLFIDFKQTFDKIKRFMEALEDIKIQLMYKHYTGKPTISKLTEV